MPHIAASPGWEFPFYPQFVLTPHPSLLSPLHLHSFSLFLPSHSRFCSPPNSLPCRSPAPPTTPPSYPLPSPRRVPLLYPLFSYFVQLSPSPATVSTLTPLFPPASAPLVTLDPHVEFKTAVISETEPAGDPKRVPVLLHSSLISSVPPRSPPSHLSLAHPLSPPPSSAPHFPSFSTQPPPPSRRPPPPPPSSPFSPQPGRVPKWGWRPKGPELCRDDARVNLKFPHHLSPPLSPPYSCPLLPALVSVFPRGPLSLSPHPFRTPRAASSLPSSTMTSHVISPHSFPYLPFVLTPPILVGALPLSFPASATGLASSNAWLYLKIPPSAPVVLRTISLSFRWGVEF